MDRVPEMRVDPKNASGPVGLQSTLVARGQEVVAVLVMRVVGQGPTRPGHASRGVS